MNPWVLVFAVVLTTTIGDSLQAYGMRPGRKALPAKAALPLSIVSMAASFFCFLTLLSAADLSFAVPATASYIVLDTVSARWILKERVGGKRWAAAALIACGVAMLAL